MFDTLRGLLPQILLTVFLALLATIAARLTWAFDPNREIVFRWFIGLFSLLVVVVGVIGVTWFVSYAPILEIKFEDSFPYKGATHATEKGYEVEQFFFRVAIRNRGLRGVDGIKVLVERTQPHIDNIFALPLHLTNDNPPTNEGWYTKTDWVKEFSLTPGEERFVDVIRSDSRKPDHSFIFHIVGNLEAKLEKGKSYVVTLVVYGKDTIPVRRNFKTEFKDRTLTFHASEH